MGEKLTLPDEGMHTPGDQINWNESRYVDFFDAGTRVGGWLRIGMRPNAHYSEMSTCVNLPGGGNAFMYGRPEVSSNSMSAGGQSWEIIDPFRTSRVTYDGEVMLLPDPWMLTNPKVAFTTARRVPCTIDLTSTYAGIDAVMGSDQDHIDRIFLPGQADWHYQHLARSVGVITVGDDRWEVNGLGSKDHSWGPRNWHAKIYLRWLIAMVDDDFGFMLVRAVGPTKKTRSGFVWENGTFHLVDDFEMRNTYADAPNYELRQADVTIHSGSKQWSAIGTTVDWNPLRHVQDGKTLRIVKSPTDWTFADGRIGAGMCEYHDLMVDGVPIALDD